MKNDRFSGANVRKKEYKNEVKNFDRRTRKKSQILKSRRGYSDLRLDKRQKEEITKLLKERVESQKKKMGSKIQMLFKEAHMNDNNNNNSNNNISNAIASNSTRIYDRNRTNDSNLSNALDKLLQSPKESIHICKQLGFLEYEPTRQQVKQLRKKWKKERRHNKNKKSIESIESIESEDSEDNKETEFDPGFDQTTQKTYASSSQVFRSYNSTLHEMERERIQQIFKDCDPNTFNMNNVDMFVRLSFKHVRLLQSLILNALFQIPHLTKIKMCNCCITDDFFIRLLNALHLPQNHGHQISELWLDSNTIGNKGFYALMDFLKNDSQIRVIKLACNRAVIHTQVCDQFLTVLEKNHTLIKFEFAFRFIQQRDKLQKIMWRNWSKMREEKQKTSLSSTPSSSSSSNSSNSSSSSSSRSRSTLSRYQYNRVVQPKAKLS